MHKYACAVRLRCTLGLVVTLSAGALLAQSAGDSLTRGFQDPPNGARPRVWWHWMNGNITKAGIQSDLEWMKRVGIGGFQNFDAALNTPQIVDKRLVYMTPEWKDAFRFTATLADKLGLEMAIAGSPGWSESGGPWVPPANGMKKYVWSETLVEGGHAFSGKLKQPPATTGPFQNLPSTRGFAATTAAAAPELYKDVAVAAFQLPAGDAALAALQPKITASGGSFTLAALTDGDLSQATALPMAPVNEKAWIQYEFANPQTVRGLTLVLQSGARGTFGRGSGESGQQLEASDDGQSWRTVAVIPFGGPSSHTIAFPEATAKYFRMTFRTAPPAQIQGPNTGRAPAAPTAYPVAELVLHAGARVHRFEEKAGFGTFSDMGTIPNLAAKPGEVVAKAGVVDLTAKMRPDGSLDWTPPVGRWVVLRMGFSLLGITNHPASPEATGLEVDKLSRTAVKAYLDTYLDQYKDTVGELMGKRGLQYVITDSYEAGPANWTDEMFGEFQKRRGYDMHPWLPVLAGRIVESAEASDRFLWDFRTTLGDLISEYHYEQIGDLLHQRGMGRYTESHESGRAYIGDGMAVKSKADVPMSAMWTPRPGQTPEQYDADVRESASVAHIYGQNVVAAESLTAGGGAWTFSPETLKPTADRLMAMGLNRFVIHTSVHQPVNDKIPGLSLGPFGQWFTRHETWGELAGAWIGYLGRSSFLLQQGRFAADILYFYGEDSNITALYGRQGPELPAGYSFDYANCDVITQKLAVAGGELTTPSGMRYRVLALDPRARQMSLPVLKKLADLVKAGAAVVGAKPVASPSLSDDQKAFSALANELWPAASGVHSVGKGKVFAGATIGEALAALKLAPDYEYTKPQADSSLFFVHRKLSDGDMYWVNNRATHAEKIDVTFRVAGKTPEIWHADSGKVEPANYKTAGGRTTVSLRLDPIDAVFVVFRKPAQTDAISLLAQTESKLTVIEGAWDVAFQPERGAPAKISLAKLADWAESGDAGVKYFSGKATYSKTIDAPAGWFQSGARLILDLGDVKNIAEVSVNGKALGVYWRAPFRVDVSGALKAGANTVEVKVTNLWVNRLVGDQQPDAQKKYTYTSQQFYRADSPLLPSGLLGPVELISVK